MHIEQGRYLLDADKPFSIVSCVAGIKQFYLHFHGTAAHAGGMAMSDRHDALAAAAAVISAVEIWQRNAAKTLEVRLDIFPCYLVNTILSRRT